MKKLHENEDEIGLIDIFKVLYKWKYFIIFTVSVFTISSILYSFFLIGENKFIISSSLQIGRFESIYLQTPEEINQYVQNEEILKFFTKELGEENLEIFLDIRNKKGKNKNIKLHDLWKEHVKFNNNNLITISLDRTQVRKVNWLVVNKIIKYHNEILKNLKEKYFSDYIKIINRSKKMTNPDLQLALLIEKPVYSMTLLNSIYPSEKRLHSKKKIVVIAFFLSLISTIFLSFIFEFLRKFDWRQIKNIK